MKQIIPAVVSRDMGGRLSAENLHIEQIGQRITNSITCHNAMGELNVHHSNVVLEIEVVQQNGRHTDNWSNG